MRDETEVQTGYGVNRIMCLSPEQIEMSRRSGSRIFISIEGESILDTLLFQSQRPMENYIDAVARAIQLSELKALQSAEIALKPAYDPTIAQGLFQQHLVANCWLADETTEVFDLYVELKPQGFENLQGLGYETINAKQIDGVDDNPLIFKVGIEDLGPEMDLSDVSERINNMHTDVAEQVPGGQGRVRDPSSDRRLAQNREKQLESARLGQDGDDDMTRQHGRPGRVRMPALDFRRKGVRALAGESTAGR